MSVTSQSEILIAAGEASGDMHAAKLVTALRQLRPDVRVWGMGGPELAAAGTEIALDCRELGFIGFIDVILHYRKIMRELNRLKRLMASRRPQLVVLVDYPGWNMRLAAAAKELGIPVLYYISPQIWAWRPERIHDIARCVDIMAVIFDFEVPIYQQAQIPVRFVGHPLVDSVKATLDKPTAQQQFGLDPTRACIGLLPGSRRSEIKRILPILLKTSALLIAEHGPLNILLPIASNLDPELIRKPVAASGLPITLVTGQAYEVMHLADAVITCSGTATLETAIIGTPMAIVYKVSWLNYRLMKRLLTLPDIGLANIVAGRRIVQEFVQDHATPANITAEITRILQDDNYRNSMRNELAAVKAKLGSGGGSDMVAQLANDMLSEHDPVSAQPRVDSAE